MTVKVVLQDLCRVAIKEVLAVSFAKPSAVKGVSHHGRNTWFAAITYQEVKKWLIQYLS